MLKNITTKENKMEKIEIQSRAGFGDDYRSVSLNGQPVGRLRRIDGRWRGFTTFTKRTPAKRELEWTPAAICDTPEEAAQAVVAEYIAESG